MHPQQGQSRIGKTPGAAIRTREHSVGFSVADDAFPFWIPFQVAPEFHGDVAEVRNRYGAVSYTHLRAHET